MSEAPVSPLATPSAWNLVSDGYVSEIVPTFTHYAKDALRFGAVTSGDRVLDVACGPGTLTFEAVKLGAKVSGIDFAQDMIAKLHARAAEEGVTDLDVRVGDGMALPYADASFDAAFSMFGLIFFPDRAAGFRELHRVLVPGGRVVVSSWQPIDKLALYLELFGALGALLPNMPFSAGKAPLGVPSEFAAEMTDAGFVDVVVHEISHASHYASMTAFWASAEKSLAPLVLLRARLGEAAYAPVAEGVFSRLRASFGDGPQTLTMSANLGVGRRG